MPNRPKSSKTPDFGFESQISGQVCGVDEAGRGPLAGPVVAAAVILDPENLPDGLNDSKALSRGRRELLLNEIYAHAIVSIGLSEPEEIDRLNILWASMAAMERAVGGLSQMNVQSVDHALIDGNRLPKNLPCAGTAIVKGDARSLSISAASIVAKVTRDRLMAEADARFPGYGLSQHQGYPTQAHLAALNALGPSPIHRQSFGPVAKAWRLI